MRYDVVTIGGSVKDVTFFTDQGQVFTTPQNLTAQKMLAFEYGAKINIKDVFLGFGGGAANSAVSLARLGLKVGVITRVGKDESGREIINRFKTEKINTDFCQFDDKVSTGFSFILATSKVDKEHIAFLHRGAAEKFILDGKKLSGLNANWFYVTSMYGKDWLRNVKTIFDLGKKKNIKVVWNPGNLQLQGGRRLIGPYLKRTQILILNKDEAIELVLSGIKLGRKNPNHLNRPLYLLNILHEWGPKMVIITDGKKGSWVYNGKDVYQQKSLKPKALDTTGVGDAFGSSFLAGLILEQGNIKKALKWGVINSASVVSRVGAQNGLLTYKQLKTKL